MFNVGDKVIITGSSWLLWKPEHVGAVATITGLSTSGSVATIGFGTNGGSHRICTYKLAKALPTQLELGL